MTKTDRTIFKLVVCIILILSPALAIGAEKQAIPQRIVSMSPCTTEILFALGLGDKVIGVTRYCDFPSAAKSILKVGGLMDPGYEAIIRLKPDLVILLTSHRDAKKELEKLHLSILVTPHETVSDIHESIRLIGHKCGVPEAATALLDDLSGRTETVSRATKNTSSPSVLICIGRDRQTGQLSGMYMAGQNTFYDEIIRAAGGVNAYTDESVAYPQLSSEGVIKLNPDIIIDLIGEPEPGGKTEAEISGQWDRLRHVKAVRNHQVYVITGNYAMRPGPRYIMFLEALARLIRPGATVKTAPDAGSFTGT